MEPTIYKPSIYKGEGIYNTGAGGGGGGGLVPDYLQLVEYIDTSNYTDNYFCLAGFINHQRSQNEKAIVYFAPMELARNYNTTLFSVVDALGAPSGNGETELSINSGGEFRGGMGQSNGSVSFSTLDITKKMKGSFDYPTYKTQLIDINGTAVSDSDSTKTRYTANQSRVSVMGIFQSIPMHSFKGRFFGAELYSDGVLTMDIRVCRNKNNNVPYAIDLISGVVLSNPGKTNDYSFVVYGPDITL